MNFTTTYTIEKFITEADFDKVPVQVQNRLRGCLIDLLGSHEDYSLWETLTRLRSVTDTNPNFEETLKNNAECGYCRAYIYENAAYLYLPEMKALFEQAKIAALENKPLDKESLAALAANIRQQYMDTPLADMKKPPVPPQEAMLRAAELIGTLYP